jgi:hypothetical protein
MMDTKRAFCMHSRAVGEAMRQGIISIRRDRSLPAFGNCSLDDNLGEGDLESGRPYGQVNGYLVWESGTIVDRPKFYQITVYLWDNAPLDSCTVDLTPRRCRQFKGAEGEEFQWSSVRVEDGRRMQHGRVTADKHGLVTVRSLRADKKKYRVTIRKR